MTPEEMMNRSDVPDKVQKEEPKETYCVTLTADEAGGIGKHFMKRNTVRLVFCIFFLLVSIGVYGKNPAENAVGLFFAGVYGVLVYSAALTAWRGRKIWRVHTEKIPSTTYIYDFFEKHMTVRVSKEGELRSFEKITLEAITKIEYLQGYLLLVINGRMYILRKGEVQADSVLYTHMRQRAKKKERPKPMGIWRMISIATFIITILCLYGPLIVLAYVLPSAPLPEQMWVFYLFLPIPMASITVGYILKKKGYKYKKNVISGIIMAILLCIYGSFTFLF